MALVEMQKLRIVGLKSRQADINDVLAKSGKFEVSTSPVPFAEASGSIDVEKLLTLKARCAVAVDAVASANARIADIIKKAGKTKDPAVTHEPIKIKSARFFSNAEELDDAGARADGIFAKIDEIDRLVSLGTGYRSAMGKLTAKNKQLAPYLACCEKFSEFRETDKTYSVLACGKVTESALEELSTVALTVPYGDAKSCELVGVVALKENRERVAEILSAHGLSVCGINEDGSAEELIRKNDAEIAALADREKRAVDGILAYNEDVCDIKKLHDFYMIEAEKAAASNAYPVTASTFVAEGWVPKPSAEALVSKVGEAGGAVAILLDDVRDGDDPPTLYKENRILAPYQSLTDGYSPPSYFEFDPSPFTAFFFFVFFGLMTADMGYGIVLTVGAFLAVGIMKPEKGMKNLMLLIGYSSIAAIVWGILFGSVFGLSFGDIAGLFGASGVPSALWFNPMDDPIQLMILSLLFGVVHITCGYCLHFAGNITNKKITDALFDDGFQIVTYVGVFLLVLWLGNPKDGMFMIDSYPEAFSALLTPGLIIMAAGLVGTVLTKGRKKPSIGGKIVTGLSGLYGIVNILSDVLSYARLFGITIASCAIAFAFNIIIEMVSGFGIAIIPIAVVLAVILHAFNMAMGVLSAYVHNARLQYLEFYGKFYTGDGHTFVPLGGKTKYVRFA